MSLPDFNFLPAPLWLITVLHVVTLSLHFVAMNFLLGGLIVLLFGKLSGKWDNPVVKTFVKAFPAAVAATVTLGVAPLLFVQLVYYRQIYSASIASAWFWILIVLAVMLAYYLLYAASFSTGVKRARVPVFLRLALAAAVYVSLVYSTVFSMGEHPEVYKALYASNPSGWAVNNRIGDWIFRWLHMVLGAVTVGGFFVGLLGRNDEQAYGLGKRFFVGGMAGAVLLGFVYLLSFGEYVAPFMRSIGIWLVSIALVLSLLALHFFFKRRWSASGVLLFVSLVTMVITRHVLRLMFLDGKFDPKSIPVVPQWSVFAVFLVCFVVALALVAFMLRAFFAERQREA